jgi:formate dehydrogenase subunit gamma
MSAASPPRSHGMDLAVAAAREREDVVVGHEIVRFRRSARVMHWSVAVSFIVCLLTGMPIWTPVFGWMAHLFGGLSVCRVIHPWAGVAFSLAAFWMFVHWRGEMALKAGEREWASLGGLLRYLRYQSDDANLGKYNPGQKMLFWWASLGALGFLVSGLVMWFPESFGFLIRALAILLHDVTFILFLMLIVWHVYLGTLAEPGTFQAMTRGTVTKAWAKLHHPRWYRDVTGEK